MANKKAALIYSSVTVAVDCTGHGILSIHTWAGTSYQGALLGSVRQGWYMGLMEA